MGETKSPSYTSKSSPNRQNRDKAQVANVCSCWVKARFQPITKPLFQGRTAPQRETRPKTKESGFRPPSPLGGLNFVPPLAYFGRHLFLTKTGFASLPPKKLSAPTLLEDHER